MAVAGLGPITQIYLVPDTFRCNEWWGPDYATTTGCLGGAPVLPGTAIHGWVAFLESAKIAAIDLWREGPTPSGPWRATLVAFAEPPAGWVMP